MQCPRCEGIELISSSESCPQCGRQYQVTRDGRLAEAWLGPISLVLYPVLFAKRPQDEAERIADQLHAASQPGQRSIFRAFTSDELVHLLAEVQLELEKPTQNVRDILDLPQDEADLREYLGLVAKRLACLMWRE